MRTTIACPDCAQDWLRRWVLSATAEEIYLCPECDATWLTEDEVAEANVTRFRTFLDVRGLDHYTDQLAYPPERGQPEPADPA